MALWRDLFKPLSDRFFALILIVLLLPVFFLVAMVLLSSLGPPVLFTQKRPGKGGKIFTIYKFRTMREAQDSEGRPLPDEERLDGVGRWVRRLSLDELPQLLNVLKGEMSFVGPRPLLVEYLPRYNAFQRRRHEVVPGITGWAQVNGRNALSWEEKFALDVWYVDHLSMRLDLLVLLKTVQKVVKREGIAQAGRATMEPFMGNDGMGKE